MAEVTGKREMEPQEWWQKDQAWLRRTFPDRLCTLGVVAMVGLLGYGIVELGVADAHGGLHEANWLAFCSLLGAFLIRSVVAVRMKKLKSGTSRIHAPQSFKLGTDVKECPQDLHALVQWMRQVISDLRTGFFEAFVYPLFAILMSSLWSFRHAFSADESMPTNPLFLLGLLIGGVTLFAAWELLFRFRYKAVLETLEMVEAAVNSQYDKSVADAGLMKRIRDFEQRYRRPGQSLPVSR